MTIHPGVTPAQFRKAVATAISDPQRGLEHFDYRIRNRSVATLATSQQLAPHWETVRSDPEWQVRRQAAQVGHLDPGITISNLAQLLDDPHPLVAEAAAFSLGERGEAAGAAVPALCTASSHDDPLVREASVAALGAIGLPEGKQAVLAALADKPAIRRRAVCALAAFEGADVDAALQQATNDRDWQVRQIAEGVLTPESTENASPVIGEGAP